MTDEGQLFIVDSEGKRARAAGILAKLPLDGRIWDVRIRPYVARRSHEQNARLHLLFQHVADSTGSDIESVKLAYKGMFLAGKESEFQGRKVVVYPKTSKMNKKELNAFMEKCESHAITELGVFLGD